MPSSALPEEVVHHIDDLPGEDVHKQGVVVIANPSVRPRRIREIVHVWIAEPVILLVIGRPEPPPDIVSLISPAERIVINADPENRPVVVAIIAPVVAAIIAPI